jgi:hypothetical protein
MIHDVDDLHNLSNFIPSFLFTHKPITIHSHENVRLYVYNKRVNKLMDGYCSLLPLFAKHLYNMLCTLNHLFDESRIGSFFREQIEVSLNIFMLIFTEKPKYTVTSTKK